MRRRREVWLDENPNSAPVPYLFSAKELDPETGFYDFGARYLDPRFSKWMSTVPWLSKYLPDAGKMMTLEAPTLANRWRSHGDLPGMGGAFQPLNLSPYGYAHHNPATLIDPNGLFVDEAREVITKVGTAARVAAAAATAALASVFLIATTRPAGDFLADKPELAARLREDSGRYVFRALGPGELERLPAGLFGKDPLANEEAWRHIQFGSRPWFTSQWISLPRIHILL